jgi:hypothetical protein
MALLFDVGRRLSYTHIEQSNEGHTAQISARTTALVQNFQNILGEVIQSQPRADDEDDEDGSANLVRIFANVQNDI